MRPSRTTAMIVLGFIALSWLLFFAGSASPPAPQQYNNYEPPYEHEPPRFTTPSYAPPVYTPPKAYEKPASPTRTEDSGPSWFALLLTVVIVGSIAYGIFWLYKLAQRNNQFSLTVTKQDNKPVKFETVTTKFDEVAGIDEAKEELLEIVDFLKNPKKYTDLGAKIPKGVLLAGPPGVGKTLLARTLAGEAGVPFYHKSASEFVEMYVGVGASRIRSLFSTAKSKIPCIVFIDEIDSLGKRVTAVTSGGVMEHEQTLNQILTEMDGFDQYPGLIVIGATNREDKLDPALLRPGRFDRKVRINLPDVKGREEILKIHASKVKGDESIDLKTIARLTPGSSGADLANLVNEAALGAGKSNREFVSMQDFEFAKDKSLMGPENKSLSSIMSETEKRTTAIHEAGHALVAILMPGNDPLYKVSIIPRGQALGTTRQLPEKDRYNYSEEYLTENLSILFGGRIAEKLVFGTVTAGAQNDIERASELARRMVCELGMSSLGPVNYNPVENPYLNQPWSQETLRRVDEEVMRLLNQAYEQAEELIKSNKNKLHKIADALMEKETLERSEVEALIKES